MDKTKIVIFRRGGLIANHEKCSLSQQASFVGIMFTSTLHLGKSTLELAKRGKKALVQLLSTVYKLHPVTPRLCFKLFDAQIQPILLYGCEVRGFQP